MHGPLATTRSCCRASALTLHQNNLNINEALVHIPKMIGIPASSENQPSGRRLVGGEVFLDVLRPLYLDNMATQGQKDSSFVSFSRTQPDFPLVKKVNQLDKKRILVTGVSSIDYSLFLRFSFLPTDSSLFSLSKITRTTCECLIYIIGKFCRVPALWDPIWWTA